MSTDTDTPPATIPQRFSASPALSPWETPDFAAYFAAFNADAKRLGDSNLEPALRRYFDRQEAQQARDAAEIKGSRNSG